VLSSWGTELVPSPSGFFGRVHAVGWDPIRGEAFDVAESRWNGGQRAPLAPVKQVEPDPLGGDR
jgi:hypothetical protein